MISTPNRSTTAQVGADRIRTGVTGLGTSYKYAIRGAVRGTPCHPAERLFLAFRRGAYA